MHILIGRGEQVLMAALWLVPVLGIVSRDPPLVPLVAAPLMTLMLGLAVWRR